MEPAKEAEKEGLERWEENQESAGSGKPRKETYPRKWKGSTMSYAISEIR